MDSLAALFRPRHVAATVLVAILVGGSSWGLLGLAQAADQGSFTLPAPLAGDRGRYQLDKTPLDAEAEHRGFRADRNLIIFFEVHNNVYHYGADGQAHWTHAVTMRESTERGRQTHTIYVDAATSAVVAAVALESDTDSVEPGQGLPGSTIQRSTSWATTRFEGPEPTCQLFSEFQGKPTQPTAWQRFHGSCFGRGPDLDANWIRVVGTANSSMLVELAHAADQPRRPDLQIWFRDDTPYPVAFVDLHGGYFGAPGDRLLLSTFTPGHQPLSAPGVPPSPLRSVENRTRTPWLLDETGINHPFPLSAAYQHVMEDPLHTELARYVASHPEAYMAWARHAEFDLDGTHSIRWSFMLTDGREQIAQSISRNEAQPKGLALGLPALPAPAVTYRYDPVTETDGPLGQQTWLPRNQVPSAYPSLAGLLETAARLLGPRHPNASASWEFQVACTGEPCQLQVHVFAGQTYFDRTPGRFYPVMDNRVDAWHIQGIQWDQHGLRDYYRSTQSHTSTVGTEPQLQADGVQLRPETATWVAPTLGATAGLGVGALLLALLYWLWPALKGGSIGLFSRVATQELLVNPTRALAYQIIQTEPGIHSNELARRLGKGNGAAEHHLRKLTHARLIRKVAGAGYTCYFPAGRHIHAAALLKSPVARELVQRIRSQPGLTSAQAAHDLNVTPPTLHYHLERLRQAGLVRTQPHGRTRSLHLTPEGEASLA